jgi:hypothetical protein
MDGQYWILVGIVLSRCGVFGTRRYQERQCGRADHKNLQGYHFVFHIALLGFDAG